MGRLGELVFVLLLVWLFFPSLARLLRAAVGLPPGRGARRPAAADGPRRGGPASSSPAPPPAAETLVRCARCGVYFPRSRGLVGGGRAGGPSGALFCSESCRRPGAAAPP